ncbi:MAG TPA: indole-3-glycerol phosphate synthase TrpC, partial [Ktedonobacterales bacterium]|nr:indole-3-glycerol phosphate synthase TrpC [Ktedonobacterales bacterium]
QAETSLEQLYDEARRQPPALDFTGALRPTDGGIRAIAEIKRASPSKGVLRANLSPENIGESYAKAGAAAISVLTEQDFFQGSLEDLRAVKRSKYSANMPVLRKDFITDPYQVVEARAAGADSFLLIVALLDDHTMGSLLQLGHELGMEALVEAHDAEEALRAVKAGAKVVGINARDLSTFAVDTTRLRDIRPLIPDDVVVVAESGIATRLDAVRMRGYGAQAILVGETLMRAEHPEKALHQLIALPPALRLTAPKPSPIIKLCGMRTPENALAAYEAGADMIGMVFAASKRQVTVETARTIVAALPSDAITVGVFVSESASQKPVVEEIIQRVGLKAAQICGAPIRGSYSDLSVPALYASNQSQFVIAALVSDWAILVVDSALPGVWGGTGEVGNWEVAAEWAQKFPIILAGGLNPENVGDAIRAVRPWGVDVSSGIEGPDGQKDPARMRAFVQAVRAASE